METQVTSRIRLQNMCCGQEATLAKQILDNVDGVQSVAVNVVGRMAYVKHNTDIISSSTIVDKLNTAKLGASVTTSGIEEESDEKVSRVQLGFFALLIVLYATSFILSLALPNTSTSTSSTNPIPNHLGVPEYIAIGTIAIGLMPVFYKAVSSLMYCIIDINCLMFIAVLGAAVLGSWYDAMLVVVLLCGASLLEHSIMVKVRNALKTASAVTLPKSAVTPSGQEVKVADIKIGDLLAVRAGEQIPVDGFVKSGKITVDESLLTGEAIPVVKKKESTVLGGTLCQDGYATIRATALFNSSTLSTISDIVADSQASQTKVQMLLDKIIAYYTPGILAAAAVVAFIVPAITHGSYSSWIQRALILLISGCPCALTIAAPIPSLSAIVCASRHGVLIKSVSSLEILCTISTLAFDKTGTLTEGRFEVSGEYHVKNSQFTPKEVMHMVASIETKSSHPLAASLVNHVLGCVASVVGSEGNNAGLAQVTNFQATEGRGVSGDVKTGSKVITVEVGNANVLPSDPGSALQHFCNSHEGHTILFVVIAGKVTAAIAMCDELRPKAIDTISELHSMSVDTAVITGDSVQAAQLVQKQVRTREYRASCQPKDKVNWVEAKQRKGEKVGLIGDGINDSPALAICDVGFAMGAGGSALAVNSADIVFMTNNLEQIPQLLKFSRSIKKVIWQNVFLAFILKLGVVVLAVMGYAKLWMAVVADVGSLILVLLNGMKTLRFKFNVAEGKGAKKSARQREQQADSKTDLLLTASKDFVSVAKGNYGSFDDMA